MLGRNVRIVTRSTIISASNVTITPITSSTTGAVTQRWLATGKPAAGGRAGGPMSGPAVEPIPTPPANTKKPAQIDDSPVEAKMTYNAPPSRMVLSPPRPHRYNYYKDLPKNLVAKFVPGDIDNYQYRLKGAAIVERIPVCFGPDLPHYAEWKEVKDRLRATHNKVIPEELLAPLRKRIDPKEEERNRKELEALVLNPLITEDDKKNNRKSLYRALDTSLFLVVKKPRSRHAWQFPQGAFEPTKELHLRRTAMRELEEEVGKSMRTFFMGNAPIGHIKYDYPADFKSKDPQFKGSKVFYFHALRTSGDPDIKATSAAAGGGELIDYAWATKDELINEYFKDQPELQAVCKQMLVVWARD